MAKSIKDVLMDLRKSLALSPEDAKKFDEANKKIAQISKSASADAAASAADLKSMLNDVADTSVAAAQRYSSAQQQQIDIMKTKNIKQIMY